MTIEATQVSDTIPTQEETLSFPPHPAARVSVPTRIFRLGTMDLIDPDPRLTPLEALRLYRTNYPFLATARLCDGELEGDRLVYRVQKPRVETKGVMSNSQALHILRAWSRGENLALPQELSAIETQPKERAPCSISPEQVARIYRVINHRPGNPSGAAHLPALVLPPP